LAMNRREFAAKWKEKTDKRNYAPNCNP
jgi:hypothetical protein